MADYRPIYFDHRFTAPREVQEDQGELRHFTTWIMLGVILNLVAGLLVVPGWLNAPERYGDLELPFYVYIGAIAGALGLVSFLVGLARLLNGLFAFLAVNTYRVTMPTRQNTF